MNIGMNFNVGKWFGKPIIKKQSKKKPLKDYSIHHITYFADFAAKWINMHINVFMYEFGHHITYFADFAAK